MSFPTEKKVNSDEVHVGAAHEKGGGIVHLEGKGDLTSAGEWDQILQDAITAEHAERELGVRAAFKLYPKAIFWSFVVSLCIVMEGYDTLLLGSLTGIPVFREKYGHFSGENAGGYQLDPSWQAALQQAAAVGSIFGIFGASYFQGRFGYRRTIQGALIMMTGFIFIVFFAPNVQVLFVGELLCGLPWGAFSSSAVSYASEVTPVALRGYLTTYVNLCWVIGQFIASGTLVGVSTRTDQWAYKIPFAIQWMWPVPLFIIASLAPESPWWLVRSGRLDEAKVAVKRLSSNNVNHDVDAGRTVAMMVRTNQHELEQSQGVNFWDCFKGSDLRRTEIACVGWMTQQLCGSPFGNQGTYFFQQAGLSTGDSFKMNLGTYAIGFCGTIASWFTMTYVGRRKLYLLGLGGMCLIQIIVGLIAIPARTNPSAKWGQAVMILLYVLTFDLSAGPLAYCIVGEVSSTRLRVNTVGLARASYNIVGIVGGILNTYMMNPTAWNWKGFSGFFWAVSCFFCLVWAYFRLPECKGRTFRELDILFERGVSARKFKTTVVSEQEEH